MFEAAGRVLDLTLSEATLRAARVSASPARWSALGWCEAAVWGECRGSGSVPYQVAIHLQRPSTTCTCPSLKQPCKHIVALSLLTRDARSAFAPAEPPTWAAAWLEQVRARAEKAAARQASPAAKPKTAGQPAARERRVDEGLEEVQRWLHDLARLGLGDSASRSASTYQGMAARLVDAQAPGLARRVSALASLPHSGERWPERMLLEMGRLELLLEAYRRRDDLDPRLRAEVLAQVGYTTATQDVLALPPVSDTWSVLGCRVLQAERLLARRTWLRGERTRRWALLLDFQAGMGTLEPGLRVGARITADLCFYPGALPLRAAVRSAPATRPGGATLRGQPARAAWRDYAEALGRNPWLAVMPLALGPVEPVRSGDRVWLVDREGVRLPVASDLPLWRLLALSGGRGLHVFGEWDGFRLVPLGTASPEGTYLPLDRGVEAAA